jgi:fructose-specific phosphotransferase system component IIB
MQITTVHKKKYVLSSEDIKALDVVFLLLDEFIEDEELAEGINSEALASVKDAQNIISTIFDLEEVEFNLCEKK